MIPFDGWTFFLICGFIVYAFTWYSIARNPVPVGPVEQIKGMPLAPAGYHWLLYKKERRLVLHSSFEGTPDFDMRLIFVNRRHIASAGRLIMDAYHSEFRSVD